MQDKQKAAPSAGFNLNLGDIYHVLFRHKWKIISVWILGTVAAAGLYLKWPVPWSSEATVWVRYVKENRDLSLTGNDAANIVSTTPGAAGVIRTEMEMLQSLDVAKEAAEILGPELVFKLTGATNTYTAAFAIRDRIQIETAYASPVMHVFFKDLNSEIVQSVLTQVIQSYYNAHRKAHMIVGPEDATLAMQTDTLKGQLARTEAELNELKSTNGVDRLADTKKMNADLIAKIKEELWSAETELAEHQAVISSFTNFAAVKTETNAPAQPAKPPSDKLTAYQAIFAQLENLQTRKTELLLIYQEKNPRVQAVQEQIERNQKLKAELEAAFPQLTAYQNTPTHSGNRPVTQGVDLTKENTFVLALQTRISRLQQHLGDTKSQIDRISNVEAKIKDLERQRDTQEANLTAFERKRFNDQIEEEMNKGKLSNIMIIQQPSPAAADPAKRNKIVKVVFLGGLVAGLALAFVIELYFDRSIKRPIEIETKLGLPLFLSIPEKIGRASCRERV